MTAEIAILNKGGVALAADSAVTIGSGEKIYNTANKLFMLSKYHPIGVMIYGGADIDGYPWETIIKIYRKNLAGEFFDHVKDYARHFFEFLENSKIISKENQDKCLSRYVVSYFSEILDEITEKSVSHIKKHGEVDEKTTKSFVKGVIAKHHKLWSGAENLKNFCKEYCEALSKEHNERFESIIKSIFQELPLSKTDKRKLKELAADLFCKNMMSPNCSGIVFAGFGEREVFPALVSFDVEGLFNDRLKYNMRQNQEIDNDNVASIIPFAQSEMVGTFMEGVDPSLKSTVFGYMETILSEIPQEFFNSITLAKGQNEDKIRGEVEKILHRYIQILQTENGRVF